MARPKPCGGALVSSRTSGIPDSDVAELIPGYLRSRQVDLKALGEALNSHNYERVRIVGHNLKGSGGAFGFPEITAIGKLLEQSAADKAPERVREHIDALAALLLRVDAGQVQVSNLEFERS